MTKIGFETLLACAKEVYDKTPDLISFGAWPKDIRFVERTSISLPAIKQIKRWSDPHPIHKAFQAIAEVAEWKQTYTEEEVGYGFLQDYGYIELFGPSGHFETAEMRGYIAYWGRGLYYPWHRHEAEEIYCVISGTGEFAKEGNSSRQLYSGECQFHGSNQPHALTMNDGPILALVLWRGNGIEGLPLMGAS